MKISDVKILWARSGNRCAFPQCRIELAPAGALVTLGEIAHIVAKSSGGPRGDLSLSAEVRDEYGNLILLCPTHHTLIDADPSNWSVERLLRLKSDHERWVSTQLDNGSISIAALDGFQFISDRISHLSSESQGRVWVYAALTPLSVEEESIDPRVEPVLQVIENTQLPQVHCVNPRPNRYHSVPNQNGIQNLDLRQLNDGKGHRIEVFRTGHTEVSICIDSICRHITSVYDNDRRGARKLIHFLNVSDCSESCVHFLWQLWNQVLPFPNMIASYALTDTQSSRLLYNSRRAPSALVGNPVTTSTLQGSRVFDRTDHSDEILHFVLERIVEAYGWVLPKLRDKDGTLSLPSNLVT